MSKAKSVFITVLLALAVAVAAFFAAVSFPVNNKVNYLNSIASNIHLGAQYSGYAYATIYPEGVITAEEYGLLDEKTDENNQPLYVQSGSLYIEKEKYGDIDALKKSVEEDARVLNSRFGKKGYSSYSVAVEDGVSIKISVPTNYTLAQYKERANATTELSAATSAIASVTAYGGLTLRTTDATITLTDANDNSTTYDCTKRGKDEWVDTATVDGSKTYSLANGDDAAEYFKSISSRTVGSTSIITFNFTKEGREKFKELTTRAASSSSQTVYFFVGNSQLVSFSCESVVDQGSISLQASDGATAQNAAITMNSAVKGNILGLKYQDIDSVKTSTAAGGNFAAPALFISCVIVLAALCVFLIVRYGKPGAVLSLISAAFALVELYALMLLNIQVTFPVILCCMLCFAPFIACNIAVFEKVKAAMPNWTLAAAKKDVYKKLLWTVTDLHAVLVVAAILFATVGVGAVAACGLISVIGVVASYVLFWFTRFMWYATTPQRKGGERR